MEASLKPVRGVHWLTEIAGKDNVAEYLTDAELGRLAQDVISSYKLDCDARADWDRLSESAMKLAQQVKEEKNTPWPKASNVKHPLITVAAIQFAARAYPEIIKGNKVVRCQITGNEPKPPPQAPAPPAMMPPGPAGGAPPMAGGAAPAMAGGPGMGPAPGPPGMGAAPPGMPGMGGPQPSPQGPGPAPPPLPPEPPKKSPKQERADRIECFSADTEVLTALGWKPVWDIVPGTYVYSRCSDGTASWQTVTGITSHYAENLVHVKGKSIDLLVTENHNMLIEDKATGDVFFKPAKYFLSTKAPRRWFIPLTSINKGTCESDTYGISAIAYLRFLGWYISEGSAVRSKPGSGTRQKSASHGSFIIAQSKTANPEKYATLLADVEACGFTYSENSIGITIHAKSMPEELKRELRSLGKSHEKFVPSHIRFFSPECIDEFLGTLFLGDGCRNKDYGYEYFYTVSKRLADDVQELCQLTGQRATIAVKDFRDRTGDTISGRVVSSRRVGYQVYVNQRDKVGLDYITWKLEPYDNRVFCVETTPWHTLYVRRNGRAAWVGNCHMNWQLTQEMVDWDEGMDRLLHVLPVIGTCYKKTYFDPSEDRNVSELVLPADCVVNARATSMRKARRITHRTWLYSNDILENIREQLWLDVGDLGIPTGVDINDQDAPHEFLEQHRYEDLDGDGYKEPYIITVHKQSAKVVRIVARWQEDKVKTKTIKGHLRVTKIEPDHYFTHYGFIPNPDGSMNYLGFGQLLEPINASANTILNQLIDAGTKSNVGGGFIGRGAKLRGGTYAFKPGEWKMVDVAGGALRDNLVPFPTNEPSAVLFQLLGFLVQAGKEISSVQDVLTGDAHLAANTPVGTMMALVEQGLKVFTAIYKRMYRSLTEEFKKIYKLNAIYLDPEVSFIISGRPDEFTVGQSDYEVDDLTVVPVADPDLSSDMQRLLKAQALKDLSGRPGINEVEITRRCVKAVHPEDVEKVLLSDNQIAGKEPLPWKPPPHPQLILANAKAQRLTQQAQEASTRLQMDLHVFELETESLLADITKKKAEAMLAMAKAEREEQGKYIDSLKAEVDAIIDQIKVKTGLLKERVQAHANGIQFGNKPPGLAGLEEGPPDSGGIPGGAGGAGGMG